MRAIEDDASLEIVVDVVDRRVAVPALDLDEPFELDDHTHHRLLNGLDDIGLTEQRADEITGYESRGGRSCRPRPRRRADPYRYRRYLVSSAR